MSRSVCRAVFVGPDVGIWDPRTSHNYRKLKKRFKLKVRKNENGKSFLSIPCHLWTGPNHCDLFIVRHIVHGRVEERLIRVIDCIRCGGHIGDTVSRCTRCIRLSMMEFRHKFTNAPRYRAKPIPCVRAICIVCARRAIAVLVVPHTICIYAIVCSPWCRPIIVSRGHVSVVYWFIHFQFRCTSIFVLLEMNAKIINEKCENKKNFSFSLAASCSLLTNGNQ